MKNRKSVVKKTNQARGRGVTAQELDLKLDLVVERLERRIEVSEDHLTDQIQAMDGKIQTMDGKIQTIDVRTQRIEKEIVDIRAILYQYGENDRKQDQEIALLKQALHQ